MELRMFWTKKYLNKLWKNFKTIEWDGHIDDEISTSSIFVDAIEKGSPGHTAIHKLTSMLTNIVGACAYALHRDIRLGSSEVRYL